MSFNLKEFMARKSAAISKSFTGVKQKPTKRERLSKLLSRLQNMKVEGVDVKKMFEGIDPRSLTDLQVETIFKGLKALIIQFNNEAKNQP